MAVPLSFCEDNAEVIKTLRLRLKLHKLFVKI